MKVVAINGSPRKNKNTAELLEHALRGAREAGAEVELIHLYNYQYKGCISCFSCKKIGGKRECVCKDALTAVLERAREADALLFGTPIYFMGISSGMSAFLERLLFPAVTYDNDVSTWYPKKTPTAFLYTMNVTKERLQELGVRLNSYEDFAEGLFGCKPELLHAYNTWQYPDYSKYEHKKYSVAEKVKQREEQFPKDCEQAYRLGKRIAEQAKG